LMNDGLSKSAKIDLQSQFLMSKIHLGISI
jgi:hypothetical protein